MSHRQEPNKTTSTPMRVNARVRTGGGSVACDVALRALDAALAGD